MKGGRIGEMTQEEVERILKENNISRNDICVYYEVDTYGDIIGGLAEFEVWDQKLAVRLLELLDKDTPKKVEWARDFPYSIPVCPVCGEPVSRHCPYCGCGQKLDWSD